MLSETARKIDHVVNDIFSEAAEGAFDLLIQCLLPGQRLRHGLQVDGEENATRLLSCSLSSDGGRLKARRVEWSIHATAGDFKVLELRVQLLLLLSCVHTMVIVHLLLATGRVELLVSELIAGGSGAARWIRERRHTSRWLVEVISRYLIVAIIAIQWRALIRVRRKWRLAICTLGSCKRLMRKAWVSVGGDVRR